MKQIQMTADEASALQFSASKLARILDASEKFVREVVEPPVPDSPIDRAYKAGLRDPFDLAYLLIYAAEDHLRTILQVVSTGPLPSFALYTLLRAAAEAAVRCRHLLDPALTETDRLGRALNERLDNLQAQRKVMPENPDQDSHFQQRVANLEERAAAHGVASVRAQTRDGSPGKILGFGEVVMSEFEHFQQYMPSGSTAFRFLSGYVHSKPWVQVPRHRAEPPNDDGITNVPTDLDVVLFAGVLDGVVTLHDKNIGFWLTLAGYPADVWRAAKEGTPAATASPAPTA